MRLASAGLKFLESDFLKLGILANDDYFEKILGIRMGTVLGILY